MKLYDLLLATAGSRITSRQTEGHGSWNTHRSVRKIKGYKRTYTVVPKGHQTYTHRLTVGGGGLRSTFIYKSKGTITRWYTEDPGFQKTRATAYSYWFTEDGSKKITWTNVPQYTNTYTSWETSGSSGTWNTTWEIDD